jgi:hypothetical protein
VWACALAALAAVNGSAQAAWNNVFQVCCHHCRSSAYAASPIVAYAAPVDPCPQPCPQQVCTTRYVQRCYYQPVTTYKQVTYYEPVTTYRTSYYYEPVCSYRYSCYYDPCTCSYQQVAQPVTSYRLRSQCCPVTSYLQRCALQPVTTYQQAFYYEPQTTCCTTTTGAPVAVPAPSVVPRAAPPAVSDQQNGVGLGAPPGVSEGSNLPPTTSEGMKYDRPRSDVMPRVPENSSYRQALPPGQPAAPPRVRLDRIASLPSAEMAGQVVSADRVPQAGAKVLFVSADQRGTRQAATADIGGQFRVSLASGIWLVYVQDGQGKLTLNKRVEVRDNQPLRLTLVSR